MDQERDECMAAPSSLHLGGPNVLPSSPAAGLMAGRVPSTEGDDPGAIEKSARHGAAVRERPAFKRLPREIISQILYDADANSFASLVLLNRDWYEAAQSPQLYAHHLSRCSSYARCHGVIPGPLHDTDLPRLRRQFRSEIKRNLFDTYLRPKHTVVQLLSTSADSYASFPRGEAFHFAFSPNGRLVLAFGSSRIYVLDVSTPSISVKRELRVLRRPVVATILDDGSRLAVLYADHQLNVYDLGGPRVSLLRSMALDNPPRTIALCPGGSVVAAAYDGGIEVYSLAANAVATDRRSVKCQTVDVLSFSSDGTLLLGTTTSSAQANTVSLFAPYHNEGEPDQPLSDLLSQMWTTQILFPNASRACSHATLLPHGTDGEVAWIFACDITLDTLRAVRVEDLRNGALHFTGPTISDKLSPTLSLTVPTASQGGDLVAVGVAGEPIWIYGVPEELSYSTDAGRMTGFVASSGLWIPDTIENEEFEDVSAPHTPSSTTSSAGPNPSTPPLALEVRGESRNPFLKGYHVANVAGVSALRWVSMPSATTDGCRHRERLVVVAPGGVDGFAEGGSDARPPVDGGRIVLIDFDGGMQNGRKKVITLEVGGGEAELLEEEIRDLEEEVALARRRTVAQRPGRDGASSHMRNGPISASPDRLSGDARPAAAVAPRRSRATRLMIEAGLSLEEAQEALDGPYSHSSPRSRTTLQRAATAAANSTRVAPRAMSTGDVQFHAHRFSRVVPHTSDAEEWVAPPPPYKRDPDAPLPDHLRQSLLPCGAATTSGPSTSPNQLTRARSTVEGLAQSALQRTRTTFGRAETHPRPTLWDRARESETVPSLAIAPLATTSPATQPGPSSIPTRSEEDVRDGPGVPVISVETEDDLYSASPIEAMSSSNAFTHPAVSSEIEAVYDSESMRSALTSPFPSLPQPYDLSGGDISPELTPPETRVSDEPVPEPEAPQPGLGEQGELIVPSPISAMVPSRRGSDISALQIPPEIHVAASASVSSASSSSSPEAEKFPHRRDTESPLSSPSSHLGEPNGPAPPSAAQIARLKNRQSRPPNLTLARPLSSTQDLRFRRVPVGPPRAVQSVLLPRPSHSLESLRSRSGSSSRRAQSPSSRLAPPPASSSSPNLLSRPEIRRLDTIQSVVSDAPSISHTPNNETELVRHRSSRNTRRSTMNLSNLKSAKRRSTWGTIRRRKDKFVANRASTADAWTAAPHTSPFSASSSVPPPLSANMATRHIQGAPGPTSTDPGPSKTGPGGLESKDRKGSARCVLM